MGGKNNNAINNAGSKKINVIAEKFVYRLKEIYVQEKQQESNINKKTPSSHGNKSVNGSKNNGNGKHCSNKFVVLEDYNEEGMKKSSNKEEKNEIEFFMKQKLQPTPYETSKWFHVMVNYFKDSWKRMIDKELTNDDNKDIIEEFNGKCMMENEIEEMEEVKDAELQWVGILMCWL
ncbi:hypothetical protein Tco_1496878 [Tanacetum coccineum]